jgi:hypothetical protein
MTIFPKDFESDALAFAVAGGQALHVLGVSPARLYDQDLQRLVTTARSLGMIEVRVPRTCTNRQHVVIIGLPLIKATMRAQEHVPAAAMVDILTEAAG